MSITRRLLAGRSPWAKLALVLVFLAVAISIPQVGSIFYVSLASNFLIFGLLAMSLGRVQLACFEFSFCLRADVMG